MRGRWTWAPLWVLASCTSDEGPRENESGLVSDAFESLRADLIEEVFAGAGFPIHGADSVRPGVEDPDFGDIEELLRVDALHFSLDHGLASMAYRFVPARPNGALVVYHLGHEAGFAAARPAVERLIGEGCEVLLHAMPLLPPNEPGPAVIDGEQVPLMPHHGALAPLEAAGLPVMPLFFEPVVRSLNEVLDGHAPVVVAGLSGGGWTADVYGALDVRVDQVESVAGSMPFHSRTSPADRGDFEQLAERPMYAVASFMNIYALAASPNRHVRHHLFEFDPCCFAWHGRADQVRAYETEVNSRLGPGQGRFEVRLVPAVSRHELVPEVLEVLVPSLEP